MILTWDEAEMIDFVDWIEFVGGREWKRHNTCGAETQNRKIRQLNLKV